MSTRDLHARNTFDLAEWHAAECPAPPIPPDEPSDEPGGQPPELWDEAARIAAQRPTQAALRLLPGGRDR